VPLEPFVLPMFAFAVYTGTRRSEMLRSRISAIVRNGSGSWSRGRVTSASCQAGATGTWPPAWH
jgi:hypothetical protein